MTRIAQENQREITKMTEGWGEILREFINEDGRKVRIFANGCSTIGEPNPSACTGVVREILRFLVENPSLMAPECLKSEGCIQIHFSE